MRRTKILATVGPATDRADRLLRLLESGTDAFRVNVSHGSDEEHRATLRRLHEVARRARREVALVVDVQGPKLRIGEIAGGAVRLSRGDHWTLDQDPTLGSGYRTYVEIPSFERAARRGDPVLLGDGDVQLRVESASPTAIETRVVSGGIVSSHAGIFLPRARLRTAAFGPRDQHDAALALQEGFDFLALSFVRDEADVLAARRWLDTHAGGPTVGIIAKIERAEALGNIERILRVADGIMVARGDLGIEVPLERLALEQKMLVRKANADGRFSIVATQMLRSMLTSPRPTRAEATDVANAVLDGADAVMLSEESAVGQYPFEAVQWLDRIARATEARFDPSPVRGLVRSPGSGSAELSVARAAVDLAENVHARAIVTPTHSGRTARLIAALRPTCPVLALSSSESVRRHLALVRAVRSFPAAAHSDLQSLRQRSLELVDVAGLVPTGPMVLTAGYPVEGRPTNLVTVVEALETGSPRRRFRRRRHPAGTRNSQEG
ncbi:MAG TPA: pyruvate kinase [Thermoplasmata archaeon]|nr:pyruvate kinase [Thermoplasmata archaeon]